MTFLPLRTFLLAAAFLAPALAEEALFFDRGHDSEVLRERRNFRIFMPSDYGTATAKRYPVVYWFHDSSERYNRAEDQRNYDSGPDYGGDTIAAYVGAHDVIVVKLDGSNPRPGGGGDASPWNVSPVETDRQFPFYFPELVAYIDASYRTIAGREHRGVAGTGSGGFLAYWIAGQHPHLVSSATAYMPAAELYAGPRGFDVETSLADLAANVSGVRTRLVMGTLSRSRFYHQQLNGVWQFLAPSHVTQDLDFDYGAPRLADTLNFHLKSSPSLCRNHRPGAT
jgi:enterochelin esterase-like enzyme